MPQQTRFACVVCMTMVLIIVIGGERELGAQLTGVGAPFAVSTPLTLTPSPVVAMSTSGDFVVVWSTDAGSGNFDLFARRFDRTGTALGSEFAVNTITGGQQIDPSVAFVGTGGDFVVVWGGQDSNYGGIRGNVFDDNDTRLFAQDVVINATEQGDQLRPAVAGLDSGFIVAWEHLPLGADSEIRVQTFGANGIAIGSEGSAVTTSSASSPDLDAADDGSFAVVWAEAIGLGDSDIFARRFSSAGSPVGAAIPVNTFKTGAQTWPRIQVGGDGKFVVAWNAGSGSLPNFQRFDSSGGKIGGEELAVEQPPTTPNPGFIDPALVADGSFATVYFGPNAVGAFHLSALLFDANGNVIDSNPADANLDSFIVHDPADPANQQTTATYPRIATDGCGLYVVAYGNNGRSSVAIAPHAAARLLTSGPSCVTTTTLPSSGPTCGDPDDSGSTKVGDALLALRAAVGFGTCALCLCDVDGSGTVSATDALLLLRAAVGIIVPFSCPPCS